MMTSSELTTAHYERPEVRAAILALCEYGGGLRGLNGGDGWYVHQGDLMRLRGPSDFDDTISKERSLYMTADVFTPPVFDIWENRIEERGEVKPENTIGERGDLIAYSLFADIDAVKDPHDRGDENGKPRSKLYHEGRIEALEAAASFMVSYLRLRGVSEAVGVLFSGQGIYVWLSPELSDMSVVRASPDFDRDKLDGAFKIWFLAFNDLLADIEKAFFEAFPEHVGRVKFDKLNNVKRKIKCLLSIHKTLPFAVVPLDRDDIKIDLEAARIPLSSETIERAKVWLSTWKAGEGERSALVKLLEPYRQKAAEDVTAKAKTSGKIWRASEPIPVESWCPFYRALLEFPGGAGAHRVCGALATWLYQAGWNEEEAFQLWGPVAAQCDVESRIFFTSYGVINSPNCETIKKRGTGFPSLSFGELDLCRPDETCKGCHWPGDRCEGFPTGDGEDDGIKSITEEELNGLPVAENPKLSINLEPDNFISEYVDYASSLSDAYVEYHYAGGLFMASTAIDRRVVLKLKQGTVHSNLWLFCLGNSTTSRKTTAMNGPGAILDTYEVGRRLPSSFSPEALIEALADCPRSFFMKDEAGSLLAAMGKKYMDETRDFFSELYEGKDYYRKLRTGQRKEKREFQILSPYVTQWLATTPDNFRAYTSELDVTSGWLLRYGFFWPDHVKPWKAFEEATEEDFSRYITISMKYRDLKEKLAGLDIEGLKLSLTVEGWEHFSGWQRAIEERAMREEDRILQAVAGRLMTFALKLAMVFTVGRSDFDPSTTRVVSLEHVQEATRQVETYFLPTARVVIEEVARSERENLQNQIIGTIRRAGGKIARRDLLRKLHVKLEDVDKAICALEASEEIETLWVEGKGPTKYVYRLTVSNVPSVPSVPTVPTVPQIQGNSTRSVKSDRDKSSAFGETVATVGTVGTVGTVETEKTVAAGGAGGAERTATPSPKPKGEGGEGRAPTPEEGEALAVARALQAAGKRVAFGNVEAYLERRAGEFVEAVVVKRVLDALTSQGWATNKQGVLSEGAVL